MWSDSQPCRTLWTVGPWQRGETNEALATEKNSHLCTGTQDITRPVVTPVRPPYGHGADTIRGLKGKMGC